MEPSTLPDVTLPINKPTRVHSLSSSEKPEVPSAPPQEASTSPGSFLPTYEQARVHSLSTISGKAEVPSAPPEYEEVDTTISRRIIQTSLPEPSTTITEQPTPTPCASSCNVSCRHNHNDICRKCKQKEDEETVELCLNLCACIFGICVLALSPSKS